jgi:ATP phosphoribosyltransferase
MLTVALAKGRLMGEALKLFALAGAALPRAAEHSRRLVLETGDGALRFLAVKPSDVSVYVEHGIADLGVVGRDVLAEMQPDVYEPLDLRFGRCRLVVAGMAGSPWVSRYQGGLRVATKYPRCARAFFEARGVPVEIIELTGSVELAPRVGLAELIVDMVETGTTLRDNGLVVSAEILECSARLIVNRASHKVRFEEVRRWVNLLQRVRAGGAASGARSRKGARRVAPRSGR